MLLPLSECATLAGVSRSGLMKAIKRGRLTATKDERTGQWAVDSAELGRVYTLRHPDDTKPTPSDTESDVMAEKIRAAEALLAQLKDERDYLRRRIEEESSAIRQLSALLQDRHKDQDKSAPILPPPPAPSRTGFWVAIALLAALCAGLGVALVMRG
jgi:uncharacterized protein involved in exopolysaccharide biosynthesis